MSANILDPIRINTVELKNRVVYTAHGTHFSDECFTQSALAYMEARARGGCGLAIIEATSVHYSSVVTMFNADDSVIPGFRKMMQAVRPHGMRMFQQLWHGGHTSFAVGKRPSFSPSTIAGPETKGVPIPMNDEQIEMIIEAYADAAVRCREGELDGVEVHGAHGYLPHQFLSPIINRREDRWGGSLENRARFLLEVLRAIRRRVGRDYAVGVRMSASQLVGSVTEEELQQVIAMLIDEDLIDYLNASHGDYYNMHQMVSTMAQPTGYELPSSSKLTAGVPVPRLVAGRFRTLEEADQVLREGIADMVGMVRAQIADPNLVRKTMAGKAEEVRPCIGCNQGCVGGLFRDGWLGCTVNPAVGFEKVLSEDTIEAADRPQKVLVIGGGPAGMEAARVSALLGHKVVLCEASSRLGGAVNIAKRAPNRAGIGDIIDWQERELFRLGVEVRLGTYMEAEDVLGEKADKVVIATGSAPRMDGVQASRPDLPAIGVGLPHVRSSADVLVGPDRDFGASALVLDDVGHYEAIAVAEFLAVKGVAVTFVTRLPGFAPLLYNNFTSEAALTRLYRYDFNLLTSHHLAEIRHKEAIVHPIHVRERPKAIACDTVVMVTYNEPLRGLYDALYRVHPDVQLVGDALSPRDVQYAISEGHRAARPAPIIGDRTVVDLAAAPTMRAHLC